MLSAAKKVIGGDMRIEAKFNPEIGEVELFKILTVVERSTNAELEIALRGRAQPTSIPEAQIGDELLEKLDQSLRPHRRAGREAEPHPAPARRRARHHLQRVQGPQGRADALRHRAALREEEHHRQPRPHRRHPAGEGADPARALPPGRSHPRLHPRRRDEQQGAADRAVAHASRLPDQAVRAGSAGDLRGHRRDQGRRARARRPRQDRRGVA